MTISQTLFGFKGRIRRLTYLGYVVLDDAVSLLLIYLGVVVGKSGNAAAVLVLLAACCAWMTWVTLALTIKRLHDVGMTGLHAIWILLPNATYFDRSLPLALVEVVAFLNFGLICWLVLARGQDGANRCGPPPDAATQRGSLPA